MEIQPVMIEKIVKSESEAKDIIYAFKTDVTVEKSRREIEKFGAIGNQFTSAPNGARYFRFIIHDQVHGNLVFHFDIPQLKLKITNRLGTKNENLEKESYRLVILDLKFRLYRLSQKAKPITVLLDRVLTKNGIPLIDLFHDQNNIYGLLPPKESDHNE